MLIRNRRHNEGHVFRARRALGIVAVVWLNIVLQPCAMALGAAEQHDCPGCPPSPTGQHMDHGSQVHDMSGHESSPAHSPCITNAYDCSLNSAFDHDARSVKPKLKDSPNELPLAIHPDVTIAPKKVPAEYIGRHRSQSPPPGSSRPLNILYCTYQI